MAQRLGEWGGVQKVGHTGTFDGGSAALAYYPDAGLTIAVLTNTRGPGIPHALAIEADVATAILGVPPVDAEILRQPMTATQRIAVDGVYFNGRTTLTAQCIGDVLTVTSGGDVVEELIHTGDLHFVRRDRPDIRSWFLLDGEVAGWWTYEVDGFLMDLHRRISTPG
ncbi:MAG: serine hydrolase, partial [Phycisphaerales bacterium]|nr:serine hydrolase [Phycisphaerales bacterium]